MNHTIGVRFNLIISKETYEALMELLPGAESVGDFLALKYGSLLESLLWVCSCDRVNRLEDVECRDCRASRANGRMILR